MNLRKNLDTTEQLYAFLSDETDVIKVFKSNSDFWKHVEWKRDKYGNE